MNVLFKQVHLLNCDLDNDPDRDVDSIQIILLHLNVVKVMSLFVCVIAGSLYGIPFNCIIHTLQ